MLSNKSEWSLSITADDIQCALGHNWEDIKLAIAVCFDRPFQLSSAIDTFFVKDINETVQYLKMECWSQ